MNFGTSKLYSFVLKFKVKLKIFDLTSPNTATYKPELFEKPNDQELTSLRKSKILKMLPKNFTKNFCLNDSTKFLC